MNDPIAHAPARVRFAPSPTGWLHIGGVRTALFNYLFAKKNKGTFLIRIEDTDVERSLPLYTDDIVNSLKWLGMEAEEPMLYQSKRGETYRQVAEDLINKGLAYRCYCTEAEVEANREQMMKEGKKAMYGRTCRELKSAPEGRTAYAIRAKFPLTGSTSFFDMIRKEIHFPNEDIDDFVLIRTNQVATYNFAVVIDDIEMNISHVIRGDDHINNTPKQVFIYQSLNKKQPLFAHLPMILGQDKKKLSKRNGETSTHAYRTEGYLPEALLNFLVRLGWSHGDQELFSWSEMIELFSLEQVQVSGAVFNTEKLLWIQGEHLRKADPLRLQQIILQDFSSKFTASSLPRFQSKMGLAFISHVQQKVKLVKELAEQLHPLCEEGVMPVDATALKWNKDPVLKAKIKEAIAAILSEWKREISNPADTLAAHGFDHASMDSFLRAKCEQFGIKLGDLTAPMRLFVTGQATSAIGLFDLLPLLSFDVIAARLEACLNQG